jgi:pyruvate formate lyase activating enzyme
MNKEAMHYTIREDKTALCNLCPHNCRIGEGGKGICGVRILKSGKLHTVNYGEISSIALDPVEKKPLFHFKPGSHVLSVGSFGCNFSCGFCQNYRISKNLPETQYISPEKLVSIAGKYINEGNIGLAFTYNEPSIWYEYVYDASRECKENGMDVVIVTNGYLNEGPLSELLPYVDAMNIDLKAFNDDYYRQTCGGDVKSVLKSIELASSRCHIEVTTLLVTDYNDSEEEVESLSSWLGSVNPDIPLHFSRYHPTYKFSEPATPVDRILRSREIAKKHLKYVYIGNVGGVDDNTYCPSCSHLLVDRSGYSAHLHMNDNICPKCGEKINIVL